MTAATTDGPRSLPRPFRQDNSGKVQVVTNKSGQVLHYQDQRLIDFGLVSIDNTMLSGIVWDDDTDRDELPDGTYAEYDGIRKDGLRRN